jgi:hypothetical protein
MKEDYCIIKLYNETGNEYIVKKGLTFEEASIMLDELNDRNTEPCEFYIGDETDVYEDDEDTVSFDDENEDLSYLL